MGGSASYRLARKITKARENGESQDVIDELERQRQDAREQERTTRERKKRYQQEQEAREAWIKAHTLERSEREREQVRNIATTTVWEARDYLSNKVRLTWEEYMAIRNTDARNAYYFGAKYLAESAERYDDIDPDTLLFRGSTDYETRKFWTDYVKYLDSFFG